MLNKIIEFSLHNRLLVAVISALILVLGVYSVSKMEVDVKTPNTFTIFKTKPLIF